MVVVVDEMPMKEQGKAAPKAAWCQEEKGNVEEFHRNRNSKTRGTIGQADQTSLADFANSYSFLSILLLSILFPPRSLMHPLSAQIPPTTST